MPLALTIPQWSFGRDRRLLAEFKERLEAEPVQLHYCSSNVDQNRTVVAFSGEIERLTDILFDFAEWSFDGIDLNRHTGSHPRIGALDVCPFVPLLTDGALPTELELRPWVVALAERLSSHFELPIYFYERSASMSPETELPALRKGGFGGLNEKFLQPDLGPHWAHPRLGVTVMGVRDFQLVVNVNFSHDDGTQARRIARAIRWMRMDGDERFAGVRALNLIAGSVDQTQVSLNLTLPDLTPVDPIVKFVIREAQTYGAVYAGSELVGAIRPKDVPTATSVPIQPAQIVEGAA